MVTIVRLPLDILAPLDGVSDISEDEIIRYFVLNGYGRKRARFWIREFTDLEWLHNNNDGTFGIHFPRTVVDKKNKKSGGFL